MTYLYKHYFSERIDLAFLGFTVLFGIVVGQAHQPLRLFLQTTSEKLFIRGKYDYYKELSDASVHVVEKLSLSHILSTLYSTFIDVMEISNPRVLLPENFADTGKSSNRYVVYHKKTLLPENDGQEIKFDSHLVRDLMERRQPLFGVEDAKAPLVVPCMLENRLIAIFALGPKLSEDSYTNEDIRLLQVLASQAAVALDHTRSYEKIEADLEIASKQLERSQRLASLGTLTAGVTHEIRNPLTVVRAETERLTSQNRDLEYLKNYKELVIKHITRIEGIVERMLGLAREKQREEGNVSLNELLESILQLFKFNGVNLKKELQTVPSIKGNVQEIEQIFVNLVQNAIEAMPEGGQLTVKTYPQWGRVVVEVADTGKGIPKELQEKIFDPFFSTRHEGTGLGLSIAYRIIREHGGDIKVDSEVGKGTTFKVLF
jgi:signal transduction histidine kinase